MEDISEEGAVSCIGETTQRFKRGSGGEEGGKREGREMMRRKKRKILGVVSELKRSSPLGRNGRLVRC